MTSAGVFVMRGFFPFDFAQGQNDKVERGQERRSFAAANDNPPMPQRARYEWGSPAGGCTGELIFSGNWRMLKERTSLFRCSVGSRVRTGEPTPICQLVGNPGNGGGDAWAKAHFLLLQRQFVPFSTCFAWERPRDSKREIGPRGISFLWPSAVLRVRVRVRMTGTFGDEKGLWHCRWRRFGGWRRG